MTAIAWVYLSEGFVIGADGRRTDVDSGEIVSDAVQKVFSVKIPNFRLVYAWAGSTVFKKEDGTELNLKLLTDGILQSIDTSQTVTFSDFIQKFGDFLYVTLRILLGTSVERCKKDEIARLVIFGYFKNQPYVGEVFIQHSGPNLLRPEIKCPPVSYRFDVFSGSKKACKMFGQHFLPDSLSDAAKLVEEYIKLCFVHRDPPLEGENSIGGCIHIGKFTSDKFSWIRSPCPLRD
jgi:hypothetical protein